MCTHEPKCPSVGDIARAAARVIASHPEQGWSLLCNGIVSFDDGGMLLPEGRAAAPDRRPFHAIAALRARGRTAQESAAAHRPVIGVLRSSSRPMGRPLGTGGYLPRRREAGLMGEAIALLFRITLEVIPHRERKALVHAQSTGRDHLGV